jgi:hypothetical protein
MIVDGGSRMTQEEFEVQVRPYLGPFPPMPHGFDVLKVSNSELMHYGLPPRPDKENKRLLEMWLALATTRCLTKPKKPKPTVAPLSYRLGFSQPVNGGHQETSRNWSGIATEAKGGRSFNTIYAQWKLPKMQKPTGGKSRPFACSSWIGLDGHDPTSLSMPQIGVTMSMIWQKNAWRPHYQAWSQWWQRGQRNPVNPIAGFPVAENDVIVCALSVSSEFVVLLNIANLTQNCVASPFTMSAPYIPTVPPVPTAPPFFLFFGVRGHTAEWIAERPKEMNASGKNETYFPLPEFDTVNFDNCFVQGSSPLLVHGLTPSRIVRMQETIKTTPSRSRILSRVRKDAIDPYHKFVVGPGIEKAMRA